MANDQTRLGSRIHTVRYLKQIAVRVVDVDRFDGPDSARPPDWALDDLHPARSHVLDHLCQRDVGEEAQIGGAGSRNQGLWLEFLPLLVQVDLLLAES